MNLFQYGTYKGVSGVTLPFKLECDALTDDDIWCIADYLYTELPSFREVIGIPTGGARLQNALAGRVTKNKEHPILLVDDVLTTGSSINRYKELIKVPVIGAVIFSWNKTQLPDWITAVFKVSL